MGVHLRIVRNLELVPILKPELSPFVIVVIESFPSIGSVPEVVCVPHMQSCRLFQESMQSFEVVPNHSPQFSSVQKDQELGFHSGVKVHLDLWSRITINLNMHKLLELFASVLVVPFQGRDYGIPLGREIEEGVLGPLLVQMHYHLMQVFRNLKKH